MPQLPRRVTYGAANAYLIAFSQLLHGEVGGQGVRVQVLCPAVVRTEFQKIQGRDVSALPNVMEPGDIVKASLAALELGVVICAPTVADASLLGAQTTGVNSRSASQWAVGRADEGLADGRQGNSVVPQGEGERATLTEETFYVVEGVVAVQVDNNVVQGEGGTLLHVPRGTWHTFWNAGPATAKALVTLDGHVEGWNAGRPLVRSRPGKVS